MKNSLYVLIIIVSLAFVSCSTADFMSPQLQTNRTPLPTVTNTLIPAYIATAQSAQAGAEATSAYGIAQMSELSVRGTQIALELTAAAATEQHLARQTAAVSTEQAANATRSAKQTSDSISATDAVISTARAAESTAVVQTQQAVLTRAANDVIVANAQATMQAIAEQSESDRQTLLFRTWAYRVLGAIAGSLLVGALGLLIQSAWTFRTAIMVRLGLWRFGPDGKGYLTIPIAGGGIVVLDPTRQFGPALAVMPGGIVTQPGVLDMPYQAQVTARAQAAELLLAANTIRPNTPKSSLRHAAMGIARKAYNPEEVNVLDDDGTLPTIAPWELLQSWQGQKIPLGIGKDGNPILVDPLSTPHLLIAATSGAGKTMCGLRPIVAAALARGHRVILLNDAGGDFAPLLSHPNLTTTDVTPAAVAGALESVSSEVERRNTILRSAGVSTWSRLTNIDGDHSSIMVVVDELVALAVMATPDLRRRIWAAVIHITSKGRKMGISFVGATTDPTYRTFGKEGLIVRDNCGRMAFRMRDGSTSQAMFDARGAESLSENQFMALFTGEMIRGVAFHPSAEELHDYIEQRSVSTLPEWSISSEAPVPAWNKDIIDIANEIKKAWAGGASKREMARIVGKEYAGSFCTKLDQAIEYLENATTTSVSAAF